MPTNAVPYRLEGRVRPIFKQLMTALGVPVKPLIVSVSAMILMALLVSFSSKRLFLETRLPHNTVFNWLYVSLDPTLLFIVTIVPTFALIVAASSIGAATQSPAKRFFQVAGLALFFSILSFGFLLMIENLLKTGLARA